MRTRTFRMTVLAALIAPAMQVLAQETPTSLERVEVTGSAIKRLANETALPVQVITRADIDKAGVTTAAELMAKVAASSGNLTDGISITDGKDQRGFNSANLRGLGTSSTLVLLNGRRMANFASPGDDAGVDLNNIPAAAIQRVEILLDGASALYGADAIAGVINFITRKDYQGVELNASAGRTKEGGGGKRTASIAAGFGDLAKDRFNIFGVLDLQRTDRLSTNQRSFINDLHIPERLGHLLSGFTSPANIVLTDAQRDHLQEIGFTINGKPIVNHTINLSQPGCSPPANLYLPAGTGGEDACTYNYMGDTELYPKSDKVSVLTRAVWQIAPAHQLYAELSLARAKTWYVASTARTNATIDFSKVPGLAGTGLDQIDDEDADYPGQLALRVRLNEAGRRTSELTSTGTRMVLGMTGTVGGWDYDWGVNHSVNSVKDHDGHGYILWDQMQQGITDGLINPFGPSGAEGQALLESIQVNDDVRKSRGTMDSFDFKLSGAIGKLAGGDAQVAFGGELRREKTTYAPSALLLSDNINNDFAPSGEDGVATRDSRNVQAVFGELVLPFAKDWEAQAALRYDHYQGVGGAASPKLGLKWTPSKSLLLRSSIGSGFRAPSLTDLHRPTVFSATATLPDPVLCAQENNNYADCAYNWETHRYSNSKLKPEKSRQASLGIVVEPSRQFTGSLDLWTIKRTKLISEIGDDVILGNLAKYGDLVHRYADLGDDSYCDSARLEGEICFIELHKENRGAQKATGLDIVADFHGLRTGIGTFGARLSGTLMLSSREQTAPGDPFISNLGRFVTDKAVQRWRHRLSFDWEQGDWSASLGNTYYSGYEDQNSAINTDDGSVVAPNHVKAYSLWDMSVAWAATRSLTLRVGMQNIANTPPPYSNQAYYFISGYDPSYTDPRGRFTYVSLRYAFK